MPRAEVFPNKRSNKAQNGGVIRGNGAAKGEVYYCCHNNFARYLCCCCHPIIIAVVVPLSSMLMGFGGVFVPSVVDGDGDDDSNQRRIIWFELVVVAVVGWKPCGSRSLYVTYSLIDVLEYLIITKQ